MTQNDWVQRWTDNGLVFAVVCRHVQRNGLTGTIPDAVGRLTAITDLCVGRRCLVCFLTIQHRILGENNLVGTIPDAVGQLTALRGL